MKITEKQLKTMIREAIENAMGGNNNTLSPEDQQLLKQFETTLTPQFLANLLEEEGALSDYHGEYEDGWVDDGYDSDYGGQTGHYDGFASPSSWEGQDYETIIEFGGIDYEITIGFNLDDCEYDEYGDLCEYKIDVDCVIIYGREDEPFNGNRGYCYLYYNDFKRGEKSFKDINLPQQPMNEALIKEDTTGEWGYLYNNPFEIKNPQVELTYQNAVKILEKYMDLITDTIYDPGSYFYRDDMFPHMFDDRELTFYVTYNGIPCLLEIATDCWHCEYDGDYDSPCLVSCTFDPICVQLCTDGEHGYEDIYYHDFRTGEKWIGKERQPNEPIKANLTEGKIRKMIKESINKALKKNKK